VERVSKIAASKGLPDAQIALAWMLTKPAITAPIIGASKPGHLEDAAAALSVELSVDEIEKLEELYRPHPVLGFD
jgi:aryl-alcohol dehydrogenase-like predicted oxidoreductase